MLKQVSPRKAILRPRKRRQQVALRSRPAFSGGEGIGVDLARMQKVRKGIHHRHAATAGEFLDIGVVKGAHDQAVDEARQHACGVRDRLAAAELNVVPAEDERRARRVH